jgi:hypothetical protein
MVARGDLGMEVGLTQLLWIVQAVDVTPCSYMLRLSSCMWQPASLCRRALFGPFAISANAGSAGAGVQSALGTEIHHHADQLAWQASNLCNSNAGEYGGQSGV